MKDIEIRLQNVKLHNKIQKMKSMELESKKNAEKERNHIKLIIEEKIKQLIEENQTIRKEKEELEKKYYVIPKWIRSIFSK